LKPGRSFVSPTTKARVLLMPAIGALIEDKMLSDLEMNAAVLDAMIAQDETIADEWLLWPEINFSARKRRVRRSPRNWPSRRP
jgi:ABC-type microcin C transport system permease subunit YejE